MQPAQADEDEAGGTDVQPAQADEDEPGGTDVQQVQAHQHIRPSTAESMKTADPKRNKTDPNSHYSSDGHDSSSNSIKSCKSILSTESFDSNGLNEKYSKLHVESDSDISEKSPLTANVKNQTKAIIKGNPSISKGHTIMVSKQNNKAPYRPLKKR